MQATLNPAEEAQLRQTVEMFEVITQTQPLDCPSLEILKEAYIKLGMDEDVISTSRKIASAYVQLGQLSSAIMEYETILQRMPDDKEAATAIKQLSSKAEVLTKPALDGKPVAKAAGVAETDDGKGMMRKLFVDGKLISEADFEAHWPQVDLTQVPPKPVEPLVHNLAEKGIVPLDKALKMISDRSRVPYMPLGRYDMDVEMIRVYPRATCLRWCVLPFDKMSKSLLVGTVNPFNKIAIAEMEKAARCRIIWYIVPPTELIKYLGKAFR